MRCTVREKYNQQLAQSIAEGAEEATGDDAHRDDVTALMVAAQGGHLDMTKLLVEKGADVKAKDEEGFTPLLNAVKVMGLPRPCFILLTRRFGSKNQVQLRVSDSPGRPLLLEIPSRAQKCIAAVTASRCPEHELTSFTPDMVIRLVSI